MVKLSDNNGSSKTKKKMLNFFVRIMPKVIAAERCSLFINDPFTKQIWLKYGTALEERAIEVSHDNSIVGQVITTGKSIIQNDLQDFEGAHKQIDNSTGFISRNIICVPIKSMDGASITGAIQLLNKQGGEFTDADKDLLRELASYLKRDVQKLFFRQKAGDFIKRLQQLLNTDLSILFQTYKFAQPG